MYFVFNGVNSRDIGLKIKEFPYDTLANKRVKELVFDRYDGTIYSDDNTFESYTMDIECVMLDNFNIKNIQKVKNLFKSGKGELILSHKPDNIYTVRIVNNINFVEMLNLTGGCVISFKVEPFSFLASGKTYHNVINGGKINNLGNYLSKPLFKVSGTGNISITINGQSMNFNGVTKPFILDTELEDIYGADGENLNKYMNIESDFIYLKEGENTISYSGASKVEVQPNWREL